MLNYRQTNDNLGHFYTSDDISCIVAIEYYKPHGWVVDRLNQDCYLTQEHSQQVTDKLAELNALEAAKMVII